MSKIRLAQSTWLMFLRKVHLAARATGCTPLLYTQLKGAQLPITQVTRIGTLEMFKQSFCLQSLIMFQERECLYVPFQISVLFQPYPN